MSEYTTKDLSELVSKINSDVELAIKISNEVRTGFAIRYSGTWYVPETSRLTYEEVLEGIEKNAFRDELLPSLCEALDNYKRLVETYGESYVFHIDDDHCFVEEDYGYDGQYTGWLNSSSNC